jgi:uncharacterized protein YkwD
MKTILIIFIIIFSCASPEKECGYNSKKGSLDSLVFYINRGRMAEGLLPLVPDTLLESIAFRKTLEMQISGIFSHNGYIEREIESKSLLFGENLGYNYTSQYKLYLGYMRSPGHKENIMNVDFNSIGSNSRGKYNTCLFAKYKVK